MMSSAVFASTPVLISLAVFVTHTLCSYPLTATVAFPALSLLNLLRQASVLNQHLRKRVGVSQGGQGVALVKDR